MKQTSENISEKKLIDDGERTLLTDKNRYEFERIYRFVSNRYGHNKKVVLDYGCGTGYGTALMASSFGKVTGIDVSEEAISFCRNTYSTKNLNFNIFNPQYQPFPDASFDFISSFQVFEHIPIDKTKDFLRYVYAMLRPGGYSIITTPNAANYYGGHSGHPFHMKEYLYKELDEVVADVIDHRYYSICAVVDVPSTMFRNYLRRLFCGSRIGKLLGKMVEISLKPFERHGLLNTDIKIRTGELDNVLGSLLIEVRKP